MISAPKVDSKRGMEAGKDTGCAICDGRQSEFVFAKGGFDFLRCGACGLVSISPIPSLAEIEAHHDQSYAEGGYATFAGADSIRRTIAESRLAAVKGLAPQGPWLDVGASTGAFVAAAAAAGQQAEGLEISTVAVEHARAQGLDVHQGAVEDFQPERGYALITAFDVVEHLAEPRAFVQRLGEWLLPGGALAITVPSIRSMAARILGRSWFYYAPPDHVHYFDPDTIRRLLEGSALKDVEVRPAFKPLTIDYAAEQLGHFTPALAPLARGIGRILPGRLARYPWPIPVGEIFVTARRELRDA